MMSKIPQFKSVQEMEVFWQKNSPLDFKDELEKMSDPIFVRKSAIEVPLQPQEMEVVKKIAEGQGLDDGELIRQWVLEKLQFV
ncbi:MAG: hypothetical protein ISS57_00740 [Anaerolineales bacterium]|nr:hypothetical protein [Anaerolineales bacterium]